MFVSKCTTSFNATCTLLMSVVVYLFIFFHGLMQIKHKFAEKESKQSLFRVRLSSVRLVKEFSFR